MTLSPRSRAAVKRLRRRGLSRALAEDLWYSGSDAMIAEASELSDEELVELSRLDAVRRGDDPAPAVEEAPLSARRRADIRWGV